MPESLRPVAAAIALCAAGPVLGAPLSYIARDELLCAPAAAACVRGTLTWERNDRLLRLRGRVTAAVGPGTFAITLTGATRQGHRRFTPLEIRIRGRPTEIVDFKMRPDHPDVYEWEIWRIEFVPETPAVADATAGLQSPIAAPLE